MGFMLVCEDMFRSVVFARDRWLAEGGQMLPRRCQLFAAPFSHMELVERQTGFWGSKPYGVDLSVLAFPALDQHLCRPVIGSLTQQQLLSDGDLLLGPENHCDQWPLVMLFASETATLLLSYSTRATFMASLSGLIVSCLRGFTSRLDHRVTLLTGNRHCCSWILPVN
ncbi:unnamed protein product [Durusdinium trenchii]|uniref:Uncharacterized protein n=1 Tax=Durusdinium trenchii TaxID=1381693 RepID=A0ABP0IIR8_9DINO